MDILIERKKEYTIQLINFFSILSIIAIFYKTLNHKRNIIQILILLILTFSLSK